MKVGYHAGEELEDIIERKRAEIGSFGFALWGYGGSACHPATQVQPVGDEAERSGSGVVALFLPTTSRPGSPNLLATEFSPTLDGTWRPLPDGLTVSGSRHALVLGDLVQEARSIDLSNYRVAVGPSQGRRLSDYLRGRVDKACVQSTPDPSGRATAMATTCAMATLQRPYAVFVR